MSRSGLYLRTVISSYAALAAGVVYALVSVPLALHYLSKTEFGLWAVMMQVAGYLTLIDLGMQSSVARHLIDHKDHPQDGQYGSVIVTGTLVLGVQAVVIFLVGLFLSPLLAGILNIPGELRPQFVMLLRWQSGIAAFSFATRIFGQMIYAHQRNDLNSYALILGFAVNLAVLWLAFALGQGVYSILWSGGAGLLVKTVLEGLICRSWRMFPPPGAWGAPTMARFRELFHYGKDVFLVTLGTQLTNASQVMIVTRALGLEAAAVWAVCTRFFMFLGELIWRLFNYAEPVLSEMVVRGERENLRRRFRQIVMVSGAVGVWVAIGLAVLNQPFVQLWTRGRLGWSPWNDVLLGGWLIVRTIVRCHTGLSAVTKQIGSLRWVVFAEGGVFVLLALLLVPRGGVPVMVAISILCALALTGSYATRRTARYLDRAWSEVVWTWSRNWLQLLAVLVPVALAGWWGARRLPVLGQLVIGGLWLFIVGGGLSFRFGIPPELQVELLQWLPAGWRGCCAKLLRIKSGALPEHV